ncbi:MAG: deoxyribose-phosphate aldolase [Angelakisella sp.]|nr:deoxyribose-phosphate aldolase [Angelakisella sp.]
MLLSAKDKDIIKEILPKIDYTPALSPHEGKETVQKACEEAKRYGFATVCVYPTWVKFASEQMKGSNVGILVTVGFPHGSTVTEAKVAETRKVLQDGATEIDMVINIARMLDGDYEYVKEDIRQVVECAAEFGKGVKVIIETGYLSDAQKVKASQLCVEAGAEYVKTCTGFGPGKASIHDVCLIKSVVGDKAKVKASGGIASLEDQLEFIRCGASRVAGRGNIREQLEELGIMSNA